MVYTYPSKTLDTLIAWEVNKTKELDIPRDRFLKSLNFRLKVNHTNTATAPTWINNAPLCLIKELRLIGSGNDNRATVKPVDLYDMNIYDLGIPPRLINYNTVSSTGDSIGECALYFGYEPKNDWDLAALLEAFNFSSLKLYADWGQASDIASANAPTINSASLEVTLRELDLTQGDVNRFLKPHLKLRRTYDQITNAGAFADLTYVKDLPVGGIMTRVQLLVVDNGAKSNTLMSYYKVEQSSPMSRDIIPKTSFEASRGQDQREYNIPQTSLPDGTTIIDFGVNPLDLRPPIKQGDVKFKATLAAPTGTSFTRFLYEYAT